MDLAAFRQYQLGLPTSALRLDDLNPFELSAKFPMKNNITASQWIASCTGERKWNISEGFGVRHLMELCFIELREKISTVVLPEDVYPFYYDLAKQYFTDILFYPTYPNLNLHLQNKSALLIFTNPLTPSGRYASSEEIQLINKWLKEYSNTYLIVDACYNFHKSFILEQFNSDRVFELISVSKLFLRRKEKGWVVTKNGEINIPSVSKELELINELPDVLESSFKHSWNEVRAMIQAVNPDWYPPDVSYLSVIKEDYKTLLNQYNIAAVPASVFGSKHNNLSILSVLSILKNEL